jgi:hypothetical protein
LLFSSVFRCFRGDVAFLGGEGVSPERRLFIVREVSMDQIRFDSL